MFFHVDETFHDYTPPPDDKRNNVQHDYINCIII